MRHFTISQIVLLWTEDARIKSLDTEKQLIASHNSLLILSNTTEKF